MRTGWATWPGAGASPISSFEEFAPAALEQWRQSIDHYQRAGNEFGTGWGMFEVANYAVRKDDPDTAWEYLAQGLELFARHQDVSAAVLFIALAANVAQAAGDELPGSPAGGSVAALRNASGANSSTTDEPASGPRVG